MKYARWTGGDYDEAAARSLRGAGYPALLAALLSARGVSSPEEAALLLDRERELSHSSIASKMLSNMGKTPFPLYPNKFASRGTSWVPMSATPPPAISCLIPCDFAHVR